MSDVKLTPQWLGGSGSGAGASAPGAGSESSPSNSSQSNGHNFSNMVPLTFDRPHSHRSSSKQMYSRPPSGHRSQNNEMSSHSRSIAKDSSSFDHNFPSLDRTKHNSANSGPYRKKQMQGSSNYNQRILLSGNDHRGGGGRYNAWSASNPRDNKPPTLLAPAPVSLGPFSMTMPPSRKDNHTPPLSIADGRSEVMKSKAASVVSAQYQTTQIKSRGDLSSTAQSGGKQRKLIPAKKQQEEPRRQNTNASSSLNPTHPPANRQISPRSRDSFFNQLRKREKATGDDDSDAPCFSSSLSGIAPECTAPAAVGEHEEKKAGGGSAGGSAGGGGADVGAVPAQSPGAPHTSNAPTPSPAAPAPAPTPAPAAAAAGAPTPAEGGDSEQDDKCLTESVDARSHSATVSPIAISQEDEERLLRAFGWAPETEDDGDDDDFLSEEELERLKRELKSKQSQIDKIREQRKMGLGECIRDWQSKVVLPVNK